MHGDQEKWSGGGPPCGWAEISVIRQPLLSNGNGFYILNDPLLIFPELCFNHPLQAIDGMVQSRLSVFFFSILLHNGPLSMIFYCNKYDFTAHLVRRNMCWFCMALYEFLLQATLFSKSDLLEYSWLWKFVGFWSTINLILSNLQTWTFPFELPL